MKRRPTCKFTIEEEKEIITQYQEGLSIAKVAKKNQCAPQTVSGILKAHGVSARSLSEARRNFLGYTLNEDIFEEIDTKEKAYWLGVMYSDGFIGKTNLYTNYIGLTISTKDVDLLEKFKTFLGYNGEIHHYKTNGGYKDQTPYSRLQIGNNKIVSDLEKWSVVEHKTTKIERLPEIRFMDDFIRGVIDGDGSFAQKVAHMTISGNKSFLLDIANYLKEPYNLYQDKSIYSLHYSAPATRALAKRLYDGAPVYLDRKYKLASRYF